MRPVENQADEAVSRTSFPTVAVFRLESYDGVTGRRIGLPRGRSDGSYERETRLKSTRSAAPATGRWMNRARASTSATSAADEERGGPCRRRT